MSQPDALDANHKCFGCGKLVADHEEHIHLTLDEWAVRQGLEPVGVDDLMRFVFCSGCLEKSENGWQPEAHEIDRDEFDAEVESWLNG